MDRFGAGCPEEKGSATWLRPEGRWEIGGWTNAELELLGTDHDEAIAKKIGRTRTAVTVKRLARGITAFSEWPAADERGALRKRRSSEPMRTGTSRIGSAGRGRPSLSGGRRSGS